MSYNLGTAEGVITTTYNGKGVDAANKDVEKLTKGHMNASQAIDKVGRTSGLAGAAIAAGIGLAINAAANFEQRMSAVQAVSGASASEMDQLSQKAIQLGKDTAFSASDAASAIEELVKAGVSVPDVMNGAADATVALAAAGEISLPKAATIASNAMNQFQLSASDMPKVADLIAGAANASAIDVEEFGMSLSQAGAVAHLVGASFGDTAAAIALMGNAGIKGSDAGTSLKTMLSNLQPATKKQYNAMKDLGLITKDGSNQFFDAKGNLKSFAEIAGLLQTSLKGATAAQKQQALETIFGSDAIRAAAIFTQEGAKGFNDMSAAMTKVKAADVAKTRLDNFKGSLEQFKGSVETTAIVIGQIFLPALRQVVDFLTSVGNAFLSLPAGVQKAIVVFTAVVGAILLFIAATVKIVKAVQTIIEVAKVLRAVMATTWAATLGPIALIIAAIALVVVGIMLLWKHSETFRTIVLAVWSAVQTAIAAVVTFITGTVVPGLQAAWTAIIAAVRATVNFFISAWNGIVTFFTTLWSAIVAVFTVYFNIIKTIITTYVKIWVFLITSVFEVLKGWWQTFWNIFGGIITAAFNLIKAIIALGVAVWQLIINTATKAILAVVSAAWNLIVSITRAVWNTLKSVITAAWNVIKSVTTTVVNAIKSVVTAVWNAIRSVTTAVWNAIKNAVITAINAVRGPVSSAVNAVRSVLTVAWNAVKSVTSSIWNSLSGVVSGALNRVLSVVSGVVGRIKGIFSGAGSWLYNAGRNIIQGLLNGIESLINSVTSKLKALTNLIPKSKGPEQRDKKLLKPAGRWIMEGFIKELDKGIDNALALLSNATGLIPDTITARAVTDVMPATGLADATTRAAAVITPVTPVAGATINLTTYNPVGKTTAEELNDQATRLATLGVLG
jgi:TP901 family phage tail tape measure protein